MWGAAKKLALKSRERKSAVNLNDEEGEPQTQENGENPEDKQRGHQSLFSLVSSFAKGERAIVIGR